MAHLSASVAVGDKLDGFGYKIKSTELAVAKAYNISDPVFSCPKAGYTLEGEDCVSVDVVATRFVCPIGFLPVGGEIGRPLNCERRTPALVSCTVGRLHEHSCRVTEFSEPRFECPLGTESSGHENECVRLEPVEPIDVCPEGSTHINQSCVILAYRDPTFVCPPDTIQDGKKCRREIVSWRPPVHHRSLGAADTDTQPTGTDKQQVDTNASQVEADTPQLRGTKQDRPADVPMDDVDFLPAHVFEDVVGEGCGTSACDSSAWMPAHAKAEHLHTKEHSKDHHSSTTTSHPISTISVEPALKWQKILIQVPAAMSPSHKKEAKAKESKPQQIIKVQSHAAEKVCPEGTEKHGSTCVSQTEVAEVSECPVPTIHGFCARRIASPAVAVCSKGTLVCPPKTHDKACRCESTYELPTTLLCKVGVLDATNQCFSQTGPRPYCPLGYFLDSDEDTCTRRDVEAALCLFSITYVCPDCEAVQH